MKIMTESLNNVDNLNQQLEDLLQQLKEATDAGVYVKIKRQIEPLIATLPKEEKDKWEEEVKKVKRPRKPSIQEQLRQKKIEELKKKVPSPTEALLKGLSVSSDDQVEDPKPTNSSPTLDDNVTKEAFKNLNKEVDFDSTTIQENKVLDKEDKVEAEIRAGVEEIASTGTLEKEETEVTEPEREKNAEPVINETALNRGEKEMTMISELEMTKRKRLAQLKSKAKKKQRVEDTHTRKTYLVRNDLLERIEKVSNGTHGFKIEFINFAIELALAEYENMDEE